jgi:uncharacterized membrane protein YdcZ (DUF606 family)
MNYPNEGCILQSKLNKDIREVLKSYIRIEHIFSYTYGLLLLLLLLLFSSFKNNVI